MHITYISLWNKSSKLSFIWKVGTVLIPTGRKHSKSWTQTCLQTASMASPRRIAPSLHPMLNLADAQASNLPVAFQIEKHVFPRRQLNLSQSLRGTVTGCQLPGQERGSAAQPQLLSSTPPHTDPVSRLFAAWPKEGKEFIHTGRRGINQAGFLQEVALKPLRMGPLITSRMERQGTAYRKQEGRECGACLRRSLQSLWPSRMD